MAAILDYRGNPVSTGRLKEEQSAPSLTSIRQVWSTYNIGGMTPADLASYLRAAEQNDPYAQCEIFEEMEERDLHLRSQMVTRKLAVSDLGIQIKAPRNPSAQEKKIAEAVQDMFDNIDGMAEMVIDFLDGLGKGYSISEIIWGIYKQEAIIEDIKWRQPKWFRFDLDTMTIPLLLSDDYPMGKPLTPYKYITHFPKTKSGLPVRGGLLRPCAWMYLFKNYTLKDWVTFSEVYGQPIRVGKYPGNASEKDKDVLLDAVASIGSDAAAIIPQSMLLEFIDSGSKQASAQLYENLAKYADEQMSKGILGQTTTSEAKSTGLGSGIARVHDNVRHDLLAGDGRQLGGTLTRDLVKPYVDLNFGPQDRYPQAVIQEAEVDDLVALSQSVTALHGAGLPIPQNWAYEKFGIPKPQDGEAVLQLSPPTPPTPPAASIVAQSRICSECGTAHNSAEDDPAAPAAPADQISDRTQIEAQGGVDAMIEGIDSMLSQATSLEHFRAMLVSAYPDISHDRLAAAIQQAMTTADLAGRFDVDKTSDG